MEIEVEVRPEGRAGYAVMVRALEGAWVEAARFTLDDAEDLFKYPTRTARALADAYELGVRKGIGIAGLALMAIVPDQTP